MIRDFVRVDHRGADMTEGTAAQLLREAETAAGDAANEARADVLARTEVPPPEDRPSRARQRQRTAAEMDAWVDFTVDVWLTDLNPTEFGIYRRSRNRAKSRQFTTDMDIFAEVIEDGNRTGLIGYREDLWKNSTGFDKRLVFKLFGENLNWRATMDLMLARSLQQTIGARGLPVTAFSINTSDHDQMVHVERSANKWWGLAEHFSFFLMEDGKLRFYRLKQDLISIGMNYSLYDGAGRKIGLLDGKILTLVGLWDCSVRREHADPRLLTVLKLFTGMLVFNKACRRHVARLARGLASDQVEAKLQKQESDLYLNPRRVR
jgi:hypothetical protein